MSSQIIRENYLNLIVKRSFWLIWMGRKKKGNQQ